MGQPVRFEAVAYTSDGVGFISSPEWVWEFGDGEKSEKNPTEHAYAKEGIYTVTVTAIAKEGTGTAETTVEVVGDGGSLLLGNSLYLRDPVTKAVIGADGVCDLVEVVFETTDIVNVSPVLFRQPPPLVPDTWDCLGPGTYENTGIPGLKRWYWGWMTWDQKNWPVNFKVVYYRPGTPPPFPPPQQQVTFGPVTWTPNNTAVHSADAILPWNGDDPVTIPWTITHASRNNPLFLVMVSIYQIDGTSPIKTITLATPGIGVGSVEWSGETTQGPPAPPGIYTYRVFAVHTAFPICADGDKSVQLTPRVVEFHELHCDEPAATMDVSAEYELNRNAGAAHIDVLGPDPVTGEYPVELGTLTCPDLTVGKHLSNTITVPIRFDANGQVDRRLHAVIFATETGADGQNNRDLLPKFAVQENDTPPGWVVDLDIGSGPDEHEVDIGAFVWHNGNDDNTNAVVDDDLADAPNLQEGDLIPVHLAASVGPDYANRRATLSWTDDGTEVAVWTTAHKDARVISGGIAATWEINGNGEWSLDLFVEGLDPSAALREVPFTLTVTADLGAQALEGTDDVLVTVWDAVVGDCDPAWLPENGNQTTVTVTILPPGLEGGFGAELMDRTSYEGWCVNGRFGDARDAQSDLRFGAAPNTIIGGVDDGTATTTAPMNALTLPVLSFDYGAYGEVETAVTVDGDTHWAHTVASTLVRRSRFPVDTDGNRIAEAWAHDTGNAADDLDQSLNNANNGDGLTLVEEYRGVDINNDGVVSPTERLDPDRKDLFVQPAGWAGFLGFSPFGYGAAFQTAQIDVHDFVGTIGVDDSGIDVLVVTASAVSNHIGRQGAPQWDTRVWRLPVQGQSQVGTAGAYGAPCEVLPPSVNNYFGIGAGGGDRPHTDGGGVVLPNGVFEPPSAVEDADDDGVLGPGEDGNGNGVLDGDHAVWTGAGWNFANVFTPHDLDNDGRVENPLGGGPEYSRDEVTVWVVTHEMGHAVGISYPPAFHCPNLGCVMYQEVHGFPVTWFCRDCEGLIRIHNN